MQVTLDYTNALAETIGEENGMPLAELRAFCAGSAPALARLKARMEAGEIGFAELPRRPEMTSKVARCAARLRERSDTLLVIGRAGSVLGTEALRDAVEPSRSGPRGPRVVILDNVDPEDAGEILQRIEPTKTAVNVVSKSGGAAETMANFMIAHGVLASALSASELKKRIVVTTDPNRGELKDLAREQGFELLAIPANVDRSFSVLSPAGLLPAAYLGLDIEAMMGGARGALEAGLYRRPQDNPAVISAAIHVFMMTKKGKSMRVFVPCARSFGSLARWCALLWAEGLGKPVDGQGNALRCGQTPAVPLGIAEQSTQIRLCTEGLQDKITTFFDITEARREVKIPATFKPRPSCACLAGKTLKELMNAQRTATELALTEAGRPFIMLTVPFVSPLIMGEIFILMEYETALVGEILGVNAFDSPEREPGNRRVYALLGREEYGADLRAIQRKQSAPRYKA